LNIAFIFTSLFYEAVLKKVTFRTIFFIIFATDIKIHRLMATTIEKQKEETAIVHKEPEPYHPQNKVRIVTAAALFDGHDAAINIMRRVMQSTGAEVIHLGHDRSVAEIVNTAIQEDANAVAVTSYQGGHMEFFKYMYPEFDTCHF